MPIIAASLSASAGEAPTPAAKTALDEAAKVRLARIAREQKAWDEKRAHLMDLIFPNSNAWTRFRDLPVAFPRESNDAEALLEKMGAPSVSFFPMYAANFRKVDLGAGPGLVYSGDGVNSEGSMTMVWPHYPEDPTILGQQYDRSVRVVRLKQGAEPRFTGITEGGSADQYEYFWRADLLNPDGAEIVRSSRMLEIPDGTVDIRLPIVLNGVTDVVTRFSPMLNDVPSPDPDAPIPAIGNVARRFNGVFDAMVLMSFTDKAGKRWLLVKTGLLDDEESRYSDPNQLPVDLGWMEASAVAPSEANSPILTSLSAH